MGQQLCCVSQNDSYSGSKSHQKNSKTNQLRKNKKQFSKGLDDGSIVRLPEIADSSSDVAGKDTSESNAQKELDRCEEIHMKSNQNQEVNVDEHGFNIHNRQRVRGGYSRTFEQFDSSNNIDLSRSTPKDSRSQENINLNYRLTLTANNNNNNQTPPSSSNSMLLNPASAQLIYQPNNPKQESIQKKIRSENSQLMEKYLLVRCSNGFTRHYYSKKVSKKQHKSNKSNQNQDQKEVFLSPLEILIENELKTLLNQKLNLWLDNDNTPSVFVFYDAENVQLIKLFMIGSKNTSFSYGIYCFDVLIPSDYPQYPPRIHLDTQLSQSIYKLAPFIQPDGRVCLDILGTQPGRESENNLRKWQPGVSDFQLIIEDIQQLILSDDALIHARLEQGDINQDELYMRTSNQYISRSDISVNDHDYLYELGYNNAVKYVMLSNSMEFIINLVLNEQIEDIQMVSMIRDHFVCNEEIIKDMIQDWIKQDERNKELPLYAGIVEQHYPEISLLLRQQGFGRLAREKMKNIELMIKIIKEKRS